MLECLLSACIDSYVMYSHFVITNIPDIIYLPIQNIKKIESFLIYTDSNQSTQHRTAHTNKHETHDRTHFANNSNNRRYNHCTKTYL